MADTKQTTPQSGLSKAEEPPGYNTIYGMSGQSSTQFAPPITQTTPAPVGDVQGATAYPPPPPGVTTQPAPGYAQDSLSAEAAVDERFGAAFTGFTEVSIRLGFVRKVFGILTVQLLFTFGTMALFVYCEPVKQFSLDTPWMVLVAIGVVIVTVIMLACCGNLRRKSPYNFIFLALFTAGWAWMLGAISATFQAKEVWMAVGIVCAITLTMCIVGLQNKIDLTYTLGFILILCLSILGFAILCAIVRTRFGYLALAALGAALFSVWLLVDIQLLMGGKHNVAIDPEEYVFAALNIYMDIINILIRILMILRLAKG